MFRLNPRNMLKLDFDTSEESFKYSSDLSQYFEHYSCFNGDNPKNVRLHGNHLASENPILNTIWNKTQALYNTHADDDCEYTPPVISKDSILKLEQCSREASIHSRYFRLSMRHACLTMHGINLNSIADLALYAPSVSPYRYNYVIIEASDATDYFNTLDSLAKAPDSTYIEFNLKINTEERTYKNTRTNTIFYITNNWHDEDIFKLMGAFPLLFNEFQEQLFKDENKDILDFYAALYENNEKYITEYLLKELENVVDIIKEELIASLQKSIDKLTNNSAQIVQNNINNIQSTLNSYYSEIRRQEKRLRECKLQLLASKLFPQEKDTLVADFIRNSDTISIVNNSATTCTWNIRTPITNYNKRDVSMYFERGEINVFNNPKWLANLIQDTFLKEKYKLMTETVIIMPWDWEDTWSQEGDNTSRFGNPHITNYGCFSASKSEVAIAFDNGNIVQAINILIAACATLTFTDGAVTDKLAGALKRSAFKKPILQNTETGELISPEMYKKEYDRWEKTEEVEDIPDNRPNVQGDDLL